MCRRADSLIMKAIEKAEELRQQALQLLRIERELSGEKLLQLGYDQENSAVGKQRGKRSKVAPEREVAETDDPLANRVDELNSPSE